VGKGQGRRLRAAQQQPCPSPKLPACLSPCPPRPHAPHVHAGQGRTSTRASLPEMTTRGLPGLALQPFQRFHAASSPVSEKQPSHWTASPCLHSHASPIRAGAGALPHAMPSTPWAAGSHESPTRGSAGPPSSMIAADGFDPACDGGWGQTRPTRFLIARAIRGRMVNWHFAAI